LKGKKKKREKKTQEKGEALGKREEKKTEINACKNNKGGRES